MFSAVVLRLLLQQVVEIKILSDVETDQIFEPAKLIILSKIRYYHLGIFKELSVTHTALH